MGRLAGDLVASERLGDVARHAEPRAEFDGVHDLTESAAQDLRRLDQPATTRAQGTQCLGRETLVAVAYESHAALVARNCWLSPPITRRWLTPLKPARFNMAMISAWSGR